MTNLMRRLPLPLPSQFHTVTLHSYLNFNSLPLCWAIVVHQLSSPSQQWFYLSGGSYLFQCWVKFLNVFSHSLTLSVYLSYCGGSMFNFCFVDFLVLFWLIFKCFCLVSTYRCIFYSTIFSLVDLLCPFLSILLCRFVFVWPSLYCFYYCCLVINVICL